jgi:hypothetical protein
MFEWSTVRLTGNNGVVTVKPWVGALMGDHYVIDIFAEKKGFPLKNKRKDLERAAITLINDYRQDLIGKISLESPLSREQMIKEKKSN